METIEYGDWTAEVDSDANRAAYQQIPVSAAEECGCLECANYLEARDRGLVFSAEVTELLERMGVDPLKESEVFAMDSAASRSGLQLYGGWFNVVGTLLTPDAPDPTHISDTLQLLPMAGAALPDPAFGETPMFRIEFFIALPWLLREAQPGARPRKR